MFRIKYTSLTILILLLGLSGCSVLDSYQSSRPQARSVPQIPEIKRQTVPPRYPVQRPAAEMSRSPQTATPTIQTEEEMAIAREQIKLEAKQRATVDIDPYASIPESGTTSNRQPKPDAPSSTTTSPAVKSLMVSARADIALGKSSSAISKLERGLRIDSQNSDLWHLLAKAHYSASDYQQTINMAKKSNRYSNKDELIAENWKLIKKAGEKSGDATAVKEALDYTKAHP